MSTIQPPGGPPKGPKSIDLSDAARPIAGSSRADSPTGLQPGTPTTAVSSAPAGSVAGGDPTRAVLADLRASKITPDQAVQRLTEAAITRTGCPPALRPTIEARMRSLLANDPMVGAMLRQMGAQVPTPEE